MLSVNEVTGFYYQQYLLLFFSTDRYPRKEDTMTPFFKKEWSDIMNLPKILSRPSGLLYGFRNAENNLILRMKD